MGGGRRKGEEGRRGEDAGDECMAARSQVKVGMYSIPGSMRRRRCREGDDCGADIEEWKGGNRRWSGDRERGEEKKSEEEEERCLQTERRGRKGNVGGT